MAERLIDFIDRQFREQFPGKSLSELSLAEWVRDLSGFTFVQIEQAFTQHRQQSDWRPQSKHIREIIFSKLPRSNEGSLQSKSKCYVISCRNLDIEQCFDNPEIQMCRFHHDEYILKMHPQSPQADCIRLARKFEEEAKAAGMTNQEYFSFKNPAGYAAAQGRMKKAADMAKKVVSEAAEEKIKNAVNY